MTNAEWREWRTRGIGASDIAGILDISPWQSPYSVWASKALNVDAGTSASEERLRWGKLLEDAIIAEAARRLNVKAYGYQTRCEHPKHEWARATVDAFIDDDAVLEAKTTSDNYWSAVPDYYECQVLWQLEVTGRSYGWVAALHNGRKLSLHRVDAQPELQTRILQAVKRFWEQYVVRGIPPNVDGKQGTREAIDAFYRLANKGEELDLADYRDELDALRRLHVDIKTLTQNRTELENRIKTALGRAEIGVIDGKQVCSWKAQRSRRIDLEQIRERYPREAAECEVVTESRRFLVKPVAKQREAELI